MVWDIDREIVNFGSSGLALRWYSLLFALGIVLGFFIMQAMFRAEGKPQRLLDSLLFHVVIGTVVGARLGHCLLYEPGDYLAHPLRILMIWEGGLASHGGFLGVMIALMLFCRKHHEISWFWVADRMTIPAMVTGGLIRVGNFFNSEILGKPTDVPWAVVFKKVDMVPRHPTQLYEAVGYFAVGAILYAIYRFAGRKPRDGILFGGVLVLGYVFRFFIEMYKENQVPFENTLPLNMGQLLSLPFIVIGAFFILGGHFRFRVFAPGLTGFDGWTGVMFETAQAPLPSRRGQVRKAHKKKRRK